MDRRITGLAFPPIDCLEPQDLVVMAASMAGRLAVNPRLCRLTEERAHMNSGDDREPLRKPQISRFMFAMFDVLGFSKWLESVGLQAVLDAYHLLIERVVVRP